MIKIKCTSTSTRTSSVSDVIIDTSSPETEIEDSNGASKTLSAAAVEDEPAPVAAAAAATETEAEIEKGEEQLEKEETIAMGKEEDDEEALDFTTLIYEGEVALSDLPADGSELRSTLTLRLVDPEPSEASDSAEGLRSNLQMGFKAAYETLESLISSKRLELAQLEREIVAIGQRIGELRRAAEKKPTASPAKESVEPNIDSVVAGAAAAAKGCWLSMQTITMQVTTLATDFAALAVKHKRAVSLFAISAVGFYLFVRRRKFDRQLRLKSL